MKRYLFYILLLLPIVVYAAIFTINNPGSWDDTGIWAGGVIANDISDDVVFSISNGTVTIQVGDSYTIGDLQMSSTNTLTIDAGGTLNIGSILETHNLLADNNSTINVNGTLEIWGDVIANNIFILNVSVSGILIIHGDLDFKNDAIFDIQGTVTVDKDFIGKDDNNINVDGTLNISGKVDMGTNSFLTGSGAVNLIGGCTGPASFCTCGPLDDIPPVISNCPADVVVSLSGGICDEVVNWALPIASDNCSVASFNSTHSSGDGFPVGTTVVSYIATDPAGNVATCTFKVTVVDTIQPVFDSCPTTWNIADFDLASQTAIVTWQEPTASDNCSVPNITGNFRSGDGLPAGLTKVMYTATDDSGNTATCEFEVTVIGNKVPIASPMAIDAYTGEPKEICLDVRDEDGDVLTVTEIDEGTLNGVLEQPGSVNNLCFIYTSFDDFVGEEVIVFTVCDNGTPVACTKVEVRIRVTLDLRLTIYKAFTPNGDNINDFWIVENIQNYPNNQVMVYDRLGGVIFSAKGYNNENIVWDGRSNQNGQNILPSGTYFYKIDLGGEVPIQKGFIELVN